MSSSSKPRRVGTRAGVIVLVATVTCALAAGTAAAWWKTTATGTGASTAGTINPPAVGNVTAAGDSSSTVKITVSAPPAAGATVQGYRIDRTNPVPLTGACFITGTTGNCSAPASGTGLQTYSIVSYRGSTTTQTFTSAALTGITGTPTADTTRPSSVVTFPAAGPYNTTGWNAGCTAATAANSICGTASDNVAVSSVAVSIQSTSGATNLKYWNGTSFVNAGETTFATTFAAPKWSLPFPASNMAEGTYALRVYAKDSSNNLQSPSTSQSFTIDKTAPAKPALPVLAPASDTGSSNSDKITANNTPLITGASAAVEGNATVTIFDGATAVGSGTAGANGSYSVATTTLTDGSHSLTVTATDAAGNASVASTAITVDIDTGSPTVTAVALANTGSTPNRADEGDTLTITFSEALDASTLCPTWTNGSTQTLGGNNNQTATINENGTDDTLSLTTNCASFQLGGITLGGDYVAADTNFTGSGNGKTTIITWNPSAKTLTITLGSGTGSKTGVGAGTPSFTPASGERDLAGNALGTTTFTSVATSRF